MDPEFLPRCISSAHAANVHGDHATAIAWCQKALQYAPDLPEAWYNLALAFIGQGDRHRAINALTKTARLAAGSPDAQNSIGLQFLDLGDDHAAEECLLAALRLAPEFAHAHSNLGRLRERQGRLAEAEACFTRATQLQPGLGEVHANLCGILNRSRRFEAANRAGKKAVELAPSLAASWTNYAAALAGSKQPEPACAAARKAVELGPDSPEAWTALCAALSASRKFEDAESAARKALALEPDVPIAWSNLAASLSGQGRHADAQEAAAKAVQLGPGLAQAWVALATARLGAGLAEGAGAAARKAVELEPENADGWYALGTALSELRRFDECVLALTQAYELDAGADFLIGDLIGNRMQICAWESLEESISLMREGLAKRRKVTTPFVVLTLLDDPAIQFQAAKIFATDKVASIKPGPLPRFTRGDKIKIGYFSSDFREHAVSYLLAGVLERHDRERFEVFGFWFGPDARDPMRQRVALAMDGFVDIRGMTDGEAAELARGMGIDIAIDLNVFTAHARPGIFAWRAAPIQVNYLGYPGTSGMEQMDYIVGDRILIPEATSRHYAEKIVYLPHTYLPTDGKREIGSREFSRAELGLPAGAFVFACFNNNYKILPETFDSWMRILRRVDGSVLWLQDFNGRGKSNLLKEVVARGIAPERIVFAGRVPAVADHLSRIRLADLFLDTLPYNAHTTASDALWAGLPVLTIKGDAFPGRVAASLLSAVGLAELITTSSDEYEDLAVALATDPELLPTLRRKLERNRLSMPLFDTPGYTRHLETAFEAMYERAVAGLPPDHIIVPC